MPDPTIVILGCGYTGKRVARRFLDKGTPVIVTSRDPASLEDLARKGAIVQTFDASRPSAIEIPNNAAVLHSIPLIEGPSGPLEVTPQLLQSFTALPKRLVYLSTTGVYGRIRDVDEHTEPAPDTNREKLRVAAENAVRNGPWSYLILRPAAIYGPDRGIHVSMRAGRFQLAGAGDNFVSRIHVDDLAAHVEAALLSDVTGAYPVGDDLPCTSREIAEFCSKLLDIPLPPSVAPDSLHETRRANRRVDGRAIRELLHIRLRYPDYRAGYPTAGRGGLES